MHTKILILLVLLLSNANFCQNMSILEFIFGPRLESTSSGKFLTPTAAVGLIEGFDYPAEAHEIVTEDHYVLTIHRIPKGRKRKPYPRQRPVALIHHGFLSASDTWLFRGPKRDLPYILADAGFDVWLSNARGNVYSRRHKILDPNKDVEFWKFSYHEIGVYDLSVTIDYILNKTNQKDLYFMGYSMGATAGLILCSLRPQYNQKIRLFLALAPTALVRHQLSPFLKFYFSTVPATEQLLQSERIYEIFPRRRYISKLGAILCQDRAATQHLCLSLMFLLVGEDYKQFNSTTYPTALKYFPAGMSAELAVHYYQMYSTGTFREYDYGVENTIRYGQDTPPDYNLTKITAPVIIYFGKGDLLVTKEDVYTLASKLPNVVQLFQVPYNKFNHMDFMWAFEGKKLLYNHMITHMNKFR